MPDFDIDGEESIIDYVEQHGWISSEEADRVRESLSVSEKMGKKSDEDLMLVTGGYLTSRQVERAHKEMPTSGISIPGIEILEKIGVGGFGTVYKARQTDLDRLVAVKVMDESLARDEVFVQRFLSEVRNLAKLTHENLVSAMTAGRCGQHYYVVMEYVDGQPLDMKIKSEGRLDVNEVLDYTCQTARALGYAHSQGLIHRDVKPGNVIIAKNGKAKLCDLGLARSYQKEDSHITQDGATMGTPMYMSPEQACGEPLDGRSDLYSLGIMMYELLTGTPPFKGGSPVAVMTSQLNDPLPNIRAKRPDVPAAVLTLISRLTRKDRNERYVDAKTLVEDIERIMVGRTGISQSNLRRIKRPSTSARLRSVSSPRPGTTQRLSILPADSKPRRLIISILILILVIIIATIVLGLRGR